MPSKTAKAAAHPKTHNRAASTSSASKIAPYSRTKSAEKIKRNASEIQHLLHVRNASHVNYSSRQHSPTKQPLVVEVDATNNSESDEWVTSESGAATPAEIADEDTPPTPNRLTARLTDVSTPTAQTSQPPTPQPEALPSPTPRADHSPLPSVEPASSSRVKPRPQSLIELPRAQATTKFTTGAPAQSSRTPSPNPEPRRALTRPPSARSVHGVRPHPLIRTRQHGPVTPTVSAAPPAFSPTTASPLASPLTNQGSSPDSNHYSQFLPRLRRKTSHSSVTSVATLPLPTRPAPAGASTTRVHGERQRTMSHGWSSAALSSLAAAAQPHGASRPSSPVMTTTFPPPNLRPERAHCVLPPPLAIAHHSATAHHRPMQEALERVAKARAKVVR